MGNKASLNVAHQISAIPELNQEVGHFVTNSDRDLCGYMVEISFNYTCITKPLKCFIIIIRVM